MKLLIALTIPLCLLVGQETQKPITESLTDKDRAEFLIVQRSWIQLQAQYQDAFGKEPAVAAFNTASAKIQGICQKSSKIFNPQTVTCDDPPKQADPNPPKTDSSKK